MFKRTILTILGLLGSAAALSLLITGNSGIDSGSVQVIEPTKDDPVNGTVTIDKEEALIFPYFVEGTDLLIEQVLCYDGPFLEDDSNREMKNITAILLRNTGSVGVLDAQITLETDSDIYRFHGDNIPPNSTVLILETEAKQFGRNCYYNCTGNVVSADTDWQQCENIALEIIGMNSLSVTNTTDRTLHDLRIIYKSVYAEGEFYLGGTSHSVVVASLSAGETLIINPRYFAGPYSRVLRVSFQK